MCLSFSTVETNILNGLFRFQYYPQQVYSDYFEFHVRGQIGTL